MLKSSKESVVKHVPAGVGVHGGVCSLDSASVGAEGGAALGILAYEGGEFSSS